MSDRAALPGHDARACDDRVSAYILAGGKSRRFGSDKARAPVDGKPMILHVADAMRPIAQSITVVAGAADAYADLGLRTIADRHPGRGPLAGLHGALLDAPTAWIAVVGCDTIGVDQRWWRLLVGARSEACDAVAFRHDLWEPLCALYRRTILPEVQRRLDAGELSMQRLLDAIRTAPIPMPAGWNGRALSVNRPGDLSTAPPGAISSEP